MKIQILCFLMLTACSTTKKVEEPKMVEAPKLQRFEFAEPPLLGSTPVGQKIHLGGFSGLRYLGRNAKGNLRFLTLTDRGPNAEEFEENGTEKRPFLLPAFQPRVLFLEADLAAGRLLLEKEVMLRRPDGKPLSGLPQKQGQEVAVDSAGKGLPLDPYGMDLEGIALAADGSFWVVEEYAPSITHFSAEGKFLETLKPGSGLPKVLEQRRRNRGFEGAALFNNRLYAVLQSPLDNPRSEKEENSKNSRLTRIVEVDVLGKRTLGQYAYLLEDKKNKIGDVAVESARTLLVVEQDGKSFRKVFRVSLHGATNLQLAPERIGGPGGSLEGLDEDALRAAKVTVVTKEEVLDLSAFGVKEEKIEGIDLVDDGRLALVIDNDFGLSGEWDKATGRVEFKEEPSALYLFPAGSWKR